MCWLAAGAEPSPSAIGHWEGEIDLITTKLAIKVDLDQAGNVWTGTIDIPAQGLRGFKLGGIKVAGSDVQFALPNIPGDPAFSGHLETGGQKISGVFAQVGLPLPFELHRKAKPAPAAGDMPAKGIPGKGLAGFWRGVLKAGPGIELRLTLEVSKGKDGRLSGAMVSLDQGSSRRALSSASEADGKVKFEINTNGGSYAGALSADGSELSGEWRQNGQTSPLLFRRVEKAFRLSRPQEPKPPYPYAERKVEVENTAAKVKLAGTLTLPTGPGPHSAVVFITGSGPQDRDESLMGHRPFLVLADHLTRAGIAVLRYDDRGVGKSTGVFAEATHTDFVEDALAAVDWLKQQKEIDPRRIGLLGHSEGGTEAPLAAVQRPEDIAFIVLAAGVGVPMDELLVRQAVDLARAEGIPEHALSAIADRQRDLFRRLKAAPDQAAAEKVAREVVDQQLAAYTPEQRKALGLTDAMVAGQVQAVTTPWFRKLMVYDPQATLKKVKCPVLAINGEKDLQVAAEVNLPAIRTALEAGGNTKVKTVALHSLNHLFQTCTTGAVSEYGKIEETFAPAALAIISTWICGQVGL